MCKMLLPLISQDSILRYWETNKRISLSLHMKKQGLLWEWLPVGEARDFSAIDIMLFFLLAVLRFGVSTERLSFGSEEEVQSTDKVKISLLGGYQGES